MGNSNLEASGAYIFMIYKFIYVKIIRVVFSSLPCRSCSLSSELSLSSEFSSHLFTVWIFPLESDSSSLSSEFAFHSFHRLGLFFESDSLSLSSEFPFSLFIAMDQTVVEGLLNLRLTKEEEEEISLKSRCKSDLLEECSLSLFVAF